MENVIRSQLKTIMSFAWISPARFQLMFLSRTDEKAYRPKDRRAPVPGPSVITGRVAENLCFSLFETTESFEYTKMEIYATEWPHRQLLTGPFSLNPPLLMFQ